MNLVKCDASWDPRFGGTGGRSGSAMVTFERATVVFLYYALYCDHFAMSNHSATI